MFYNRWMEENYYYLKDIPANKIIIPGSHNSCAYKLKKKQNISSSKLLRLGMRLGNKMKYTKKVINQWVIRQDYNILEQLKMGIRYFDLRVAYSEKDQNIYVSHHKFALLSFHDAIIQFKKYLDDNKYELIYITIRPDSNYNFNKDNAQTCINILEGVLENYIIKPNLNNNSNDNKFPTYDQLIKRGSERVFVFSEFDEISDYNNDGLFIIDRSTCNIDETYNLNLKSIKKLTKNKNNKWDKNYNVISWTINLDDITTFGDLLLHGNKTIDFRSITHAIQTKLYYTPIKIENVSCFMTDFTTERFISTIINMNLKK